MRIGVVAIKTMSAVFLLLCLALTTRAPGQVAAASSRKPAPTFSLADATGTPIRLPDYKGKVVLLNFWATWCHGCKTEIPWYIEFQDKWKARGLAVIGASMDDDGWKVVKPFDKVKRMNYPVVIANDNLAKEYGLGAMPLSVLIDREGKIADSHSGVVDRHVWEQEIQALLDEHGQGAH